MKNTKKLGLAQLQVQSFVTSCSNKIVGGLPCTGAGCNGDTIETECVPTCEENNRQQLIGFC